MWKETLAIAWKGRQEDIFRMRVPGLTEPGQWPEMVTFMNPRLYEQNAAADKAFKDTAWSVIDQPGLNRDRLALYADFVHFPGPLSQLTVHVILSSLCGDSAAVHG